MATCPSCSLIIKVIYDKVTPPPGEGGEEFHRGEEVHRGGEGRRSTEGGGGPQWGEGWGSTEVGGGGSTEERSGSRLKLFVFQEAFMSGETIQAPLEPKLERAQS